MNRFGLCSISLKYVLLVCIHCLACYSLECFSEKLCAKFIHNLILTLEAGNKISLAAY